MMGLPATTSGVAHPQPNPVPAEASSPELPPFDAPLGLAMIGRLRMLNTSNRNWAPNRSLKVKVWNTEKSQSLKPLSRKMLRPMVPKVPNAGGTMTELPSTKQPPAGIPNALLPVRVLTSGATAVHCAHIVADWAAENGEVTPVIPEVTAQLPGPVQ